MGHCQGARSGVLQRLSKLGTPSDAIPMWRLSHLLGFVSKFSVPTFKKHLRFGSWRPVAVTCRLNRWGASRVSGSGRCQAHTLALPLGTSASTLPGTSGKPGYVPVADLKHHCGQCQWLQHTLVCSRSRRSPFLSTKFPGSCAPLASGSGARLKSRFHTQGI